MTRIQRVGAGLTLLLAIQAATALPVDHKVTAVTVYRDRALVTRSGAINLTPGVNSIVFDKLPVNLDENSIRARGHGTGHFKILGIELKRQYQDRSTSVELTKLQTDLRKVDDQVRTNNDERNDVEQKRGLLNDLRNKMVQQDHHAATSTNVVSATSLKGMFDFYGTELSKLSERIRQLEWMNRDLEEQRGKLNRQISLLQRPADPDTRTAVVMVDSKDAAAAQIEVSYIMFGATWQSQYDAHASTNDKKAEFTYYGVVQQTTSENWEDVTLSLSTARPAGGARIPELNPWHIDLFDPNVINSRLDAAAAQAPDPVGGGRAYKKVLAAGKMQSTSDMAVNATVAAGAPMEEKERDKDAEIAVAQINDTGPAAVFVVPGKVTIPSDGQPHRNTVQIQEFTGEWQYETTPKLAPVAFLKAKVNNSSAGPLLPGDINAFLENDFIGKSYINLVPPHSSFDLFLGVDDGIKVTRTAGVDKEESSGVISKSKVFKRSYVIEIENFKKTDISCKVNDQVPVSQNGELKVNITKMEPAAKKKDDNTGVVTWELALKPQEKQKIEVEFQVECDPKKSVSGL